MKIGKAGKQKGFTIIELVVVILLLGILTATALPRYMDVTTEAHGAVVDGVQGALQTGVTLFHAQWIANGQPTGAVANFGAGNVITNTDGFPDGVGTNIASSGTQATADAGCVAVFENVLQAGAPTVDVSNNAGAAPTDFTGSVFKAYETGSGVCNYAYVATGSILDTLVYTSTAGTVTNP